MQNGLMRRDRWTRVLRGLSVTSLATFIALMSHVAAGGSAPGWLGVTAPVILGAPVSIVIIGLRPSLPRMAVAVTLSQVLFHTLFVLGGPSVSVAGITMHGSHHPRDAMPVTMDASSAAMSMSGMWGAHAVAALLTIAAIHLGDRTVASSARLIDLVLEWLRRVVAAVTSFPLTGRGAGPVTSLVPAPHLRRTYSRAHRRGPPVLLGF